jgi:hypothetical protein
LSEVAEVGSDDAGFFVEFFVEATEQLRESPQFAGIDNCLSHLVSSCGFGGISLWDGGCVHPGSGQSLSKRNADGYSGEKIKNSRS